MTWAAKIEVPMAKKKHAGSTPATVALEKAGVDFRIVTYQHDSEQTHYGEETCEKLNLDPRAVLKTLVVNLNPGGKQELAVAVVPVAGMLDLKAVAKSFGVKKAEMADPKDAERSSGYVTGGISPLGQRTKLETVIDTSVKDFDQVYCSGGKRGFSLLLNSKDLAEATGAKFADIGRPTFYQT